MLRILIGPITKPENAFGIAPGQSVFYGQFEFFRVQMAQDAQSDRNWYIKPSF